MRKLDKFLSVAVVAAVSFVVVNSVSSIASAAEAQQASEYEVAIAFITRNDAKKIVRAHLKDIDEKRLRVGKTELDDDVWLVTVVSFEGVPVRTYKVNTATGELGDNA